MEHKQIAESLFNGGCNCAQAVFCAFCDVTELDIHTAMKLSSSFGGGMGKLREVCGACTGAFMAAGILFGYEGNDDAKKAEHYALIRRIASEFSEKNGSYICRDLLKGIEDDKSILPRERTAEYYASRPCCRFVSDAAEILDSIIAEKKC